MKKIWLSYKYKLKYILSNKIIIILLYQPNKSLNLYFNKIKWFIYNQFQVVIIRKTLSIELKNISYSQKLVKSFYSIYKEGTNYI